MRSQRRKRYARKRQRINPGITYTGIVLCSFNKSPIKACIVSKNRIKFNKISKTRNRSLGSWRVFYINAVNVGKFFNIMRYGTRWIYKCCKLINHTPLFKLYGSNLGKLIIFMRKPCCFGVKRHNVGF